MAKMAALCTPVSSWTHTLGVMMGRGAHAPTDFPFAHKRRGGKTRGNATFSTDLFAASLTICWFREALKRAYIRARVSKYAKTFSYRESRAACNI